MGTARNKRKLGQINTQQIQFKRGGVLKWGWPKERDLDLFTTVIFFHT